MPQRRPRSKLMDMKKLLESMSKLDECPPMDGAVQSNPGNPVTMSITLNASGSDHVQDLIELMKNAGLQKAGPMADPAQPMRLDIEKFRDIVDGPGASMNDSEILDSEQEIEEWDNEPDPEYQDTKFMTKDLAGGINREKRAYKAAQPGDNAMAAESIKAQLLNALSEKKAKPDFLDMDKDGNKKEPMKKAVADKKKKAPVKEGITNWRGDEVDPQIGDMVELYASYDDGTPIKGKIVGPGKKGPDSFAIKFKDLNGKTVVGSFYANDEFEITKKATRKPAEISPTYIQQLKLKYGDKASLSPKEKREVENILSKWNFRNIETIMNANIPHVSQMAKLYLRNKTPGGMVNYKEAAEKKAKPDFLDMDKDGNKKEPMKKAVADKKKNPFKK